MKNAFVVAVLLGIIGAAAFAAAKKGSAIAYGTKLRVVYRKVGDISADGWTGVAQGLEKSLTDGHVTEITDDTITIEYVTQRPVNLKVGDRFEVGRFVVVIDTLQTIPTEG